MIKFEEFNEKEARKEGCYTYTECPICKDLSFCKGGNGGAFCINQHKDEDGKETVPVSIGANMVGKKWEKTPVGMKSKK